MTLQKSGKKFSHLSQKKEQSPSPGKPTISRKNSSKADVSASKNDTSNMERNVQGWDGQQDTLAAKILEE
jgi:hypothetical protein